MRISFGVWIDLPRLRLLVELQEAHRQAHRVRVVPGVERQALLADALAPTACTAGRPPCCRRLRRRWPPAVRWDRTGRAPWRARATRRRGRPRRCPHPAPARRPGCRPPRPALPAPRQRPAPPRRRDHAPAGAAVGAHPHAREVDLAVGAYAAGRVVADAALRVARHRRVLRFRPLRRDDTEHPTRTAATRAMTLFISDSDSNMVTDVAQRLPGRQDS